MGNCPLHSIFYRQCNLPIYIVGLMTIQSGVETEADDPGIESFYLASNGTVWFSGIIKALLVQG